MHIRHITYITHKRIIPDKDQIRYFPLQGTGTGQFSPLPNGPSTNRPPKNLNNHYQIRLKICFQKERTYFFCSSLFLLFLEKSDLKLDKLSILLKINTQRIHCQSLNLKFECLNDNSDSFNFKLFRNFEIIGDRN